MPSVFGKYNFILSFLLKSTYHSMNKNDCTTSLIEKFHNTFQNANAFQNIYIHNLMGPLKTPCCDFPKTRYKNTILNKKSFKKKLFAEICLIDD